ncbi:MAG: NAD(P)H-dependent oxidoreductase [Candidatus Gracilibacteria bacterium]|nr:NAD(P)H-dependent oxidoreductase [Candidatus Gracilibacteria bacterium]
MTKIIEALNWRYATKSFDTSKKVSSDDLEDIIESFRLTPSSFGLEPWKLIVIENDEIKNELVNYSYNQKQVGESSHLLVFTIRTDLDDNFIDEHLNNNTKITGASRENLSGYENVMKSYFSAMNQEAKEKWAREQVFIALGIVLNTLAQKGIDSCAIGGFNPTKYDELLGLSEKNLKSVVVLPIGYRNIYDKYSKSPKVRYDKQKIVEIIK